MGDTLTLPPFESRNFSRWLAKTTLKYFEDPVVQERFKKWKSERNAQNDSGKGAEK